jgi:hypothetical protein
VTITITAQVLPAASGTTVSNQGTISFDGDGNATNESTALTDDPTVVGAANPTSFNVPATAAIRPCLSSASSSCSDCWPEQDCWR